MAFSYDVTVGFKPGEKTNRNSFIESNTTLELLTPLYPDLNLSQTDIDTIIQELIEEVDIHYQQIENPGILSGTLEDYNGPLGDGYILRRVYEDMESFNIQKAKSPILLDYTLYRLEGTNLVRVSDGGIEAALSPKDYARWCWVFHAEVRTQWGTLLQV